MRGMVQRPGGERAQRMNFITTLPLRVHTHPITAGLIDHRGFLFLPFVSRLQLLHDLLLSFLRLCGSCLRFTVGALHEKGFQNGGRGRVGGHQPPPLRPGPFAGSHTLGIIRIYVQSSIAPDRRSQRWSAGSTRA